MMGISGFVPPHRQQALCNRFTEIMSIVFYYQHCHILGQDDREKRKLAPTVAGSTEKIDIEFGGIPVRASGYGFESRCPVRWIIPLPPGERCRQSPCSPKIPCRLQ